MVERRAAGMEAAGDMQLDIGQVYGIDNQRNRALSNSGKLLRGPTAANMIRGKARG
jgi:predicted AAA+ superfamily ATPase